jgi:tRNA (guanine-N7-)-methyltransferase
MKEHLYKKDFTYTHNNPYHNRLEEYNHFVLRDHEGEELKGQWNPKIFSRSCPLYLEIGTGYGHFMMDYCQKNPQVNFIGMDYRFKRSYQLAKKLSDCPVKNFRFLRARGERISFLFEENEINSIFYFFPDPWPKARHVKKRLFQPAFLDSAYKIMGPGGKIFIKTDHQDYFKSMLHTVEHHPLFTIEYQSNDLWTENPSNFLTTFTTKFETIFKSSQVSIKGLIIKSKKGDYGDQGSC